MTVIPSVSPVAPSQPPLISMPWKKQLGCKLGVVTGNGHGAARRIWTEAAECERAETNPRAGEGRLQVEADAKTTQPVASVMPVGSLSNRRWVAYLPQQCNLGTPSRSADGPNHSVCRQSLHGYVRQSVRAATARKRSFRTVGGCDLMRARRRRWQIRVRAGATCEVRWHARSLNRVTHSNEPAAAFTHE